MPHLNNNVASVRVRFISALLIFLLLPLFAVACRSKEKGSDSTKHIEQSDAETKPTVLDRHQRPEMAEQLRAAKNAPIHPSDGSGRAWISEGPSEIRISAGGGWQITFEVGKHGIAEGGAIIFMVSPFWGWSDPQTKVPHGPGYTSVSSEAEGVTLTTNPTGRSMMGIRIGGRALRPGETVRIDYSGRADRFAESASRMWIGVDGDGDGRHRFITDSPTIAIQPGPARRGMLIAPSTVQPAEEFETRLSVLDGRGNAGADFEGSFQITSEPSGLRVAKEVEIKTDDRGSVGIKASATEPGIYRLIATDEQGTQTSSNPIVITETKAKIFWADLHGHSALSDGTGAPQEYFRYARDIANLDFVALTDHDHWGVLHLDEHPSIWQEIEEQTQAHNQPGTFVTLLGYEWTSWIYGHRHVLYFGDSGPLLSSIDLNFDEPQELWRALHGMPAITVAHHSAGGVIATDWAIPPDPILEPITEVVSIHGVSEAIDAPSVIYKPVRGNFVRDVLQRGYRLGFVGSGDSHDGHPGLAQLANGGTGGLAAVIADELTRPALLDAIRKRRVYATSGPRIYLRAALGRAPMGSVVSHETLRQKKDPPELYVHVIGTDEIQWLDVIRSGTVIRSEVGEVEVETLVPFNEPSPGEFVYVRIIQTDGGLAWSSPIFIE